MNDFLSYASHSARLYTGIVLRALPLASRIILFDRYLGKYGATCFSLVSAGSCVLYELKERGSHKQVIICDVLFVPLVLARSNLIFLHKILEICDASLPIESVDEAVFSLLIWLCKVSDVSLNEWQQDLILAKLFMLLGLHTTQSIICETCIILIHNTSVDTLDVLALDSKCAATLKTWLYHCLSEQLSEQQLKTRAFFKNE